MPIKRKKNKVIIEIFNYTASLFYQEIVLDMIQVFYGICWANPIIFLHYSCNSANAVNMLAVKTALHPGINTTSYD